MLKFTTTNGTKMSLEVTGTVETDPSYFCCSDCEQSTIIYWNKEKMIFSEVYVSPEEITALALMGLKHRRDTEDKNIESMFDEEYTCQECVVRGPVRALNYPTPPTDEDYDKAYKSVNIDTEE